MKIRIAVVPPDDVAEVMQLTVELRSAVNAGDMDTVDNVSEKLLAVTGKARSVDLNEEEWRGFLAEVRTETPAFKTDYLIPGELCTRYFPDAGMDTVLLQLPFTDPEADDV